MIKWEIKITIREVHLIFAFIIGLHMSLLWVKSKDTPFLVDLKEKQEKTKKGEKGGKLLSEEELLEEALVRKRFIRKPFVITYLGNIKQKKHSELLALLQANNFKKKPVIASSGLSLSAGVSQEVKIESSEDHDFKITDEQKKNIIKRLIKERMTGVNVCKKKSLLEDEFLMGTLKVSMRIRDRNNLATPRFNGHGRKKTIESLENCIRAELISMTFPSELSNQEINFDLKIN